jgi:superfamily II DNA/RNA helicase
VEQDEILSGPKQSAAEAEPDGEDAPVAAPPAGPLVTGTDQAISGPTSMQGAADGDGPRPGHEPGKSDGPDAAAPEEVRQGPEQKAGEPGGFDAGERDDDDQERDQDAAYAAHLASSDDPPRALFADLGLSEPVLRAIAEMGYRHPTPVQEQAIPVVLMTRDVLGVAQTGTGKTAGFTLPMLDILAGSRARARMPRSLILEPTRELALQVAENFVQYGKYLKLTHALIIGGESMSDQKDVLNRGVDVLIATPGRLLDMFERGTILLTDTRILVIDEADRMLDMGFIPDVERIVALLPKTRQTLFFSATMGPEIKRLADAFLQNPKEITVSRSATVAVGITEGLALVAEHDKREALRRLIRTQNVQNALIFCNRKTEVDILHKSLIRHKFDAGALHGDMAQTVRFTTLEKFKAGELRLLVCSDVAARGLDIGGLSHVFNFDVPHHAEDYVHRIGRTGRAGLEGHAFTIAMPEDRLAVEAIEKLTGHPIPPMIVEGLDPVDWAEFDGRKRRGRKAPARKLPAAKTARGKRGEERSPRGRDVPGRSRKRDDPAAIRADDAPAVADGNEQAAPPRDREPAPRARARDEAVRPPAAPDHEPTGETEMHPRGHDRAARPRGSDREAPPPGRDAAPRMRSPRDEPRRDEPRPEEPRRDAPRFRERPSPRDERSSDHRRERWRQDDLGPSVVGFGDDVPAFMMVRRRTAPTPVSEPDA